MHVDELLAAADAHLAAGRMSEASAGYQAVLELVPGHAVAFHALGWIAHLSGDRAAAIDLMRRSLDADPNSSACWNNLGIVYAAARRPDDAADAYRRAIALQPHFPAAYLNLGNALRDRRQWREAAEAYQQAVRLDDAFAAAHHALGTALREVGRPADALASYRRALERSPGESSGVLNDMGLTFARMGDVGEAEAHLRRAAALKPSDPKPLRNLGLLLLRTGRAAEAVEPLAAVARLAPQSADAHHDLGTALAQQGRIDEAIESFRRAIELRADHAAAWCNLGVALEGRGDAAGAAAAYGQALRLRPDSQVVAYHHAALAGRDAPAACPREYLVELFDGYADRFDEHLVETLHYRGPELLRDALSEIAALTNLVVIDLGCGTGLCGALLRPTAARLIGVDLSPRMIEKARQRGAYDELLCEDVVEALRRRPASADVVTAADVLIYIGDVAPLFAAAAAALRPGGLFAFTTEVIDDAAGDWLLRPSRRYAHSEGYIRRLASAGGWRVLTATRTILRGGEAGDVDGMVFVLARPE
jgi:predicted TPR repeat methyltransferase